MKTIRLSDEQYTFLGTLIDRAVEDFDYAASVESNGYTEDDTMTFHNSVKALDAALSAPEDGQLDLKCNHQDEEIELWNVDKLVEGDRLAFLSIILSREGDVESIVFHEEHTGDDVTLV